MSEKKDNVVFVGAKEPGKYIGALVAATKAGALKASIKARGRAQIDKALQAATAIGNMFNMDVSGTVEFSLHPESKRLVPAVTINVAPQAKKGSN